ncbi:MAG TPA: hypothetical protein VN345_12310 [Blastocatellia bacterium]|nr:hypothetical protein [Blastocatellia bacterium]
MRNHRILLLALPLAAVLTVQAQSPIMSLSLGPDQIGKLRTALGLSTRVSFAEPVKEIICGDLYDSASGKGSFVVQRGDNDVFIKPIVSKGFSNMFVKTGEKGEHTYNFDLEIVPAAQAFRVVNVNGARVGERGAEDQPPAESAARRAEAEQQAQQKADEILRKARSDAAKIVSDATEQAATAERQATERTQAEIERRFTNALMLGVREAKISNPKVLAKRVSITVDPRLLTFDEKAYLRYTIQNGGDSDFTFTGISIEEPGKPLAIEVIQSKSENRVGPGESLTGIIVFDPKLVGAKDKLAMVVRGENKAEIAHLNVQ